MSTKVKAATLINTVTYQTDRNSLKRVRKELKDLQTQVGKSMATGSPASARKAVKAARQNAATIVDAHVKSFEDISKQRAKQAAKNVQNNLNSMFGIDRAKKSARESANVFKASFAANAETIKRQNAQMADYNKKMLGQQANIDELRNKILKERAISEKRDRNANRISNDFAFEARRLNLNKSAADDASRSMEGLNKRYREGALDLADYRQQTRHLLRDMRDQSKEYMTWQERLRDFRKGGSGGLGLGGMAVGLGVAGGIGAAYLGARASSEALRSSVEQARGLSRVQTMGLSTEETQALQVAALRNTGFNLSYEKISDIAKDVQDKVGQLSQGQWKQNKKTGDWNFSGGGELSDWLNIMTTRGGYGRDEAVNTLKSAKGPVEFAIILDNLRKKAKLTDQEFTALSEAVNDFSYITKSVGENAQNVTNVMAELASVGLLYTDQEKKNMQQLSDMSAQYSATTDILQGKFASSFVDGLNDMGINSKNLSSELAGLSPLVKDLGEGLGRLTGGFLKLLNLIPGAQGYNDVAYASSQENYLWASQQNDPFVKWLVKRWSSNSTAGEQGWNDAEQGFNSQTVASSMLSPYTTGNPYGIMTQNPIQNKLSFTIQVTPDTDEFSRVFNAHAVNVFSDGIDNLTFDMDNMTSFE